MSTPRLADDERDAYNAGVEARNNGFSRACCTHLHLSRLGSFWLAGWHDTDIARKQPLNEKRRKISRNAA